MLTTTIYCLASRTRPKSSWVGALFLTSLHLDGVGLPDVCDGFLQATLGFCFRHEKTCHLISQVLQWTPEPIGCPETLTRKGRVVRSPLYLSQRLVGASIGTQWQKSGHLTTFLFSRYQEMRRADLSPGTH